MKGGQLYAESAKAKGIEKGDKRQGRSGKRVLRSPDDTATKKPKTLEQLNITKKQSSHWQTLAQNPKAVEKYLRETDEVPTTAGALAAATGKPVVVHPPKKDPPKLDFSKDSLWFQECLIALELDLRPRNPHLE